ncbi:unnamed protein product [Thlaspi arvense]|uniref:Sister chromatid cohesion 1 protein 2-like n=1 Tax=Thlaspi arvense TaxID=13288 RepID=A0AAU9TBD5_THLAR|nr:unnamed protein product [Thlaspi arvense]
MFYSQCLVSRKGPLGAIWVAAYFFKKLKKSQVKDTHIPSSVDQILQNELDALTYRVLAYLLLGVVRIYSKKVDFLFDDCNKALIGVKDFVAKERNRENTNVPLPASTGFLSIDLPENFELDAFDLGVLEDFHGGNVKPQEDITLKDGNPETESMNQYYMERFDMEEDLVFTFQETFFAAHNETRHESFAHDMDIDPQNIRDANESSGDHQNASRHREDPESDDMLVEPNVSEDIRRAQEEEAVRETICGILQRLVDPHESSGDNLHRDGHIDHSVSEKTSAETSSEKIRHDGSVPSECKSPEAVHGIEEQPSGATRIDGEEEIPKMSTLEKPEPGSMSETRDMREGVEKHRGHHSDGEMTDFEMFHGSHKEPTETPEVNQVGLSSGTEKGFLSEGVEKLRGHSDGEMADFEMFHGSHKEPSETPEVHQVGLGDGTGKGFLSEGVEKLRGLSDGETTDFEMFHGSHKEPSETPEVHQVGLSNGTEKGFLSDMTFSEEEGKGSNANDTPVPVTPKAPSRLKISEGETSHQFSIIPTPAAKEPARVSRKRKCIIDDEVIIPNKVMKKMIEDPSKLVSKRKKLPRIDYSERSIKRLADPSRNVSSDLRLLFCQRVKLKEHDTTETPKAAKTAGRMKNSSLRKVGSHGNVFSSEQTENAREIMETPQAAALTELRVTVPETVGNNTEVAAETGTSSIATGRAHQTEVAPETPVKPAEPVEIAPETPARTSEQTEIAPETPVVSERVEMAPETPVRESISSRYFKDPETCERGLQVPSTSFDEHPYEDRKDLDAILMNEEVNTHATEDLQQETWSVRTRNVAKFLEKTFLEQMEKKEEKLSLLQLCRGRTQKESARLFYETLVLKTKGYLEVKQDHPYSDILLTRFTRQQEAC